MSYWHRAYVRRRYLNLVQPVKNLLLQRPPKQIEANRWWAKRVSGGHGKEQYLVVVRPVYTDNAWT